MARTLTAPPRPCPDRACMVSPHLFPHAVAEDAWQIVASLQLLFKEYANNGWPNGKAQSPADGDGILKRSGGKHETTFQNGSDSAGRLERNVSPRDNTVSVHRCVRDSLCSFQIRRTTSSS